MYRTCILTFQFFTGFPPEDIEAEPTQRGGNCLALSRTFEAYEEEYDVEYFFWDNMECSVRLPFVCQKLAQPDRDGKFPYIVPRYKHINTCCVSLSQTATWVLASTIAVSRIELSAERSA